MAVHLDVRRSYGHPKIIEDSNLAPTRGTYSATEKGQRDANHKRKG